ncbi:hypothetical protein SLS55_005289 [Diplodia seriata]|uniref:Phytanoyl-dioxygenase n=1 Tax=Diplodia seriata TaxID=420778 RepID=A0ABR3CFZ6_9PEZI
MGSYDYSSKNLLEHDGTTYGDWRDDFHRDGVAIIKNVITPEKAEYYRQKQIEWLQSFGLGFDPNDKSTWTQDHLPVSFKGGMYFAYSVTHEKFIEPKIQQIFADLWGTDELLCSFDGMNITLPQQRDLTWSPWPHCDQNPQRKGMQCVQGLLNLAPNGPLDGGLVLMKGSSKLFDAFFRETRQQAAHEDAPPPEEDFRDLFIFTEQDVKWFEDRGCELIKTCLDPGDFVLWDSRTMHYARHPEGDVIRSAQYICMTPARFAAKEDLDLKARMFETHQGTTHWPHWSAPIEPPEVTDRILQLAAVKAY